MSPFLSVRRDGKYWVVIHIPSNMRVTTAESFRWGHGAKAGFFNLKRDAISAAHTLSSSSIDWSQTGDYFCDKRDVVQQIFNSLECAR